MSAFSSDQQARVDAASCPPKEERVKLEQVFVRLADLRVGGGIVNAEQLAGLDLELFVSVRVAEGVLEYARAEPQGVAKVGAYAEGAEGKEEKEPEANAAAQPKKKRISSRGKPQRCSICGNFGHKYKTCPRKGIVRDYKDRISVSEIDSYIEAFRNDTAIRRELDIRCQGLPIVGVENKTNNGDALGVTAGERIGKALVQYSDSEEDDDDEDDDDSDYEYRGAAAGGNKSDGYVSARISLCRR
jgi:hypothetical protein